MRVASELQARYGFSYKEKRFLWVLISSFLVIGIIAAAYSGNRLFGALPGGSSNQNQGEIPWYCHKPYDTGVSYKEYKDYGIQKPGSEGYVTQPVIYPGTKYTVQIPPLPSREGSQATRQGRSSSGSTVAGELPGDGFPEDERSEQNSSGGSDTGSTPGSGRSGSENPGYPPEEVLPCPGGTFKAGFTIYKTCANLKWKIDNGFNEPDAEKDSAIQQKISECNLLIPGIMNLEPVSEEQCKQMKDWVEQGVYTAEVKKKGWPNSYSYCTIYSLGSS